MNRVMLDLETLSSKPTAAVVSIGAVQFTETGIVPATEFYEVLETTEQVDQYGRHIDPRTFAWWCQQSEEARAVFKARASQADIVLTRFAHYLRAIDLVSDVPDMEVWGNGADFDCVVLGGLYEAYGMQKPWNFRKNRCFRTLKNLGIALGAGEGLERTGAHNALEDAKYQAHYAAAYLRKIK